jgi:hypothetical protein
MLEGRAWPGWLLVAQSLAEPMTLLTNDAVLAGYGPLVQLV